MAEISTIVLSLLTIIGQIGIILYVVSQIITNKRKSNAASFIRKQIDHYSLQLMFIVAFTATLGSLFYSEVIGYEPCKLCWFQRIFMYPQTVLLGYALIKKDRFTLSYSTLLSAIGISLALFHYYIQLSPASAFVPCSTVGISVSCSAREFTTFGYITIPLMSATAFMMLLILSKVKR